MRSGYGIDKTRKRRHGEAWRAEAGRGSISMRSDDYFPRPINCMRVRSFPLCWLRRAACRSAVVSEGLSVPPYRAAPRCDVGHDGLNTNGTRPPSQRQRNNGRAAAWRGVARREEPAVHHVARAPAGGVRRRHCHPSANGATLRHASPVESATTRPARGSRFTQRGAWRGVAGAILFGGNDGKHTHFRPPLQLG